MAFAQLSYQEKNQSRGKEKSKTKIRFRGGANRKNRGVCTRKTPRKFEIKRFRTYFLFLRVFGVQKKESALKHLKLIIPFFGLILPLLRQL